MNQPRAKIAPSTWLRLREEPRASDEAEIRRIVESTRFFRADEADVAAELVRERLQRGLESGYLFVFADPIDDACGRLVGYTCYGEIACTLGSYDLYWIAVDDAYRGRHVGQWLLEETERRIAARGGRRVYIETSGSDLYAPTQGFYTRCGYVLEAKLEHFYTHGDPKLIYGKGLVGG
jgi:ribosomal protein S18 acetylase RimI-like enzyme